jgi:hypothetical protein
VRTPVVATQTEAVAGTALGVLFTLGGIALAVVGTPFGNPSPGVNLAMYGLGGLGGGGETTTIDPERERVAYANCMAERGYAVEGVGTTTPDTIQCPGSSRWNGQGCTTP